MFIFKDKNSGIYQAKVALPDGRYKQASTGTRDPREAARIVRKFQDIADATGGEKRKKRAAFLRFVKDVYREAFGLEVPAFLALEFAAQWLKICRNETSYLTSAGREVTLKHWSNYLLETKQEGVLLEDVTRIMAKGFASYLVQVAGYNARSANTRLEHMVIMFNTAKAGDLIEENPFRGVRVRDRQALVEQAERTKVHLPYTRQQVHLMVERGISTGCNPELTVAVLLALDFGARGGDIFALLRRCYGRSRREMDFYVRKRKVQHQVVVFPPTGDLLEEYLDYHLRDASPDAAFFPTFQVPYGPQAPEATVARASANMSTYFGHFLTILGIRPKAAPSARGRTAYSHSFHSGRATCSTALIAAGHPQKVVMARLLHEDVEINDVYNKFSAMGVCQTMYAKAGFADQIPAAVETQAHITHAEILEEIRYATERLRSLRGQLDLHDGSLIKGQKMWRATLQPATGLHPNASDRIAA